MKRLLLAGLLVVPFALSRSGVLAGEHDAYASLVGMAGAASSDRGPQAGEIPPDMAGRMAGRAASRPEVPEAFPEAQALRARDARPVPAASAPKRENARPAREEAAPSVFVPPSAAPRVWTKVFASLIPPMRRAPDFEVAASTSARLATAASDAGSAQGFRELFAAATAPAAPVLRP